VRALDNSARPQNGAPSQFADKPNPDMPARLKIATTTDAPAIASLWVAADQHLTAKYGNGPWSGSVTERGVLFSMRNAAVHVLRKRNQLIATLTLAAKKPWAIDRKYFSKCNRPLYSTAMAVAPDWQRQGIRRLCVEAAAQLAKQWPGDAIFLDAYDAGAGAGEFYRRCGSREVGRASHRNAPLIYFEMQL